MQKDMCSSLYVYIWNWVRRCNVRLWFWIGYIIFNRLDASGPVPIFPFSLISFPNFTFMKYPSFPTGDPVFLDLRHLGSQFPQITLTGIQPNNFFCSTQPWRHESLGLRTLIYTGRIFTHVLFPVTIYEQKCQIAAWLMAYCSPFNRQVCEGVWIAGRIKNRISKVSIS